ncbi:MAG: hypothetical protein PUJ12_03510 [Oscillospiraceae bacterium]|nr:hypothetical protein [Clostridiales bacterium]MDD7673846.1 hypothetical protein [Oscillospiraceae bacterium]
MNIASFKRVSGLDSRGIDNSGSAALKQSLSLNNGFDLFLTAEMGIMNSIFTGRGIGNAENGK